jgi:hypothetical protein
MGSKDLFIDAQFKTTSDGLVLFFPYGSLGKGYILPNREKEQEVRSRTAKNFKINLIGNVLTLPILIPSALNQSIFWWAAVLIYAVVMGPVYLYLHFDTKRLLKGLQTDQAKQVIQDRFVSMAESQSISSLLFMQIMAVLLFIASLWIFIQGFLQQFSGPGESDQALTLVLSSLGMIVFGWSIRSWGSMIRIKRNKNSVDGRSS